VIISDASEYRGVLLYQTANRFSNFSPEGRQRPMNVPSRVRVTSRFGASRAMAAALRLGWAPGDFPPLLPTQADGRRAHMHPARGKCWHHHDVPAECQCSGLWPATGMRVTPQGCGQAAPCRCADGPVQAGLNSGPLGGHWDAAVCVPVLCTNTKPDSESSTQWPGSEAARGLQTYIQLSTFMHV